MLGRARLLVGCIALVWATGWAIARPAAQPVELSEDDRFWQARERQQVGAAAQLVLVRDPLLAALLRIEARRLVVWGETDFPVDLAPPLDAAWLGEIIDKTPVPQLASTLPEDNPAGWAFYRALNEALVNSAYVPAAAFAKSAQDNSYVTFGHLYSEPWRYRGKVIPIHGVLKRVRKYHAPLLAQKEGIGFVYEGWIYGPTLKANPFQVIFTSLPDGLKEAEEMHHGVTFHGYFLKINRYRSAKDDDRFTPYLVGPTVVLTPAPEASPAGETLMSAKAILLVLAIVVGALGLMVAVSLYYRRGDQRVRTKVINLQAERAMEVFEKAELQEPLESKATPPGIERRTPEPGSHETS